MRTPSLQLLAPPVVRADVKLVPPHTPDGKEVARAYRQVLLGKHCGDFMSATSAFASDDPPAQEVQMGRVYVHFWCLMEDSQNFAWIGSHWRERGKQCLPPPPTTPPTTQPLTKLVSGFSITANIMHSTLPVGNRDAVTAAAVTLILDNLARQISDQMTHANRIVPSIRPVYGIVWNRAVIRMLTTCRIHDMLRMLLHPLLPRPEYGRLAALLKAAFSDAENSRRAFRMESIFGKIPR